MFHLLNEYAKLLKFKPTMPEKAVELYFRNDGPRHVFNVNDVIRTVRAMSITQLSSNDAGGLPPAAKHLRHLSNHFHLLLP